MSDRPSALLLLVPIAVLAACAPVTEEKRGTIVVYDETYTTVTRQFDQGGTTVTTGSVIYQNRMYGCNTLLTGDCERRVELLTLDDTLGTITSGTVPSTFVITDPNEPGVKPIQIRL